MVWLPNVVRADNHDDLQEFINNAAAMQTRANDIIEVDLSNFSATTRDKVLEISTGKKYRFTNGTLTAADSYTGALLSVTNNSTVYWSINAVMNPRKMTKENVSDYGHLVELNSAIFYLTGGKINIYYVAGLGYVYVDLVKTVNKSTNSIYVNSGSINGRICITDTDHLFVNGGYLYGISSSSIKNKVSYDALQAKMKKVINYGKYRTRLVLVSAIQDENKIEFEDIPTVYGDDLFDVVLAEGSDKYQLTNSDVQKMAYCRYNQTTKKYDKNYEVFLDNNQAKFRKYVSNSDELQERLNAIAAEGTSSYKKPDTVKIAPNGITIDKYITVPTKCHAVLTGGTIKFANKINSHYVFGIQNNAWLCLQNIKIDCNNAISENSSGYRGYFMLFGDSFASSSDLYLKEGVEFLNVNEDNKIELAYLSGKGSYFTFCKNSYSSKGTIVTGKGNFSLVDATLSSETTAIEGNSVSLRGTSVVSGYNTVVKCNGFNISKQSTVKCLTNNGVFVSLESADTSFGYGNFEGNNCRIEVSKLLMVYRYNPFNVYLKADALFYTFSDGSEQTDKLVYKVDGEWDKFTLEKPFMKDVKSEELQYYEFINLPNDKEIYYNKNAKVVSLRKKVYDEDDLQNFIDGVESGNKGTEDNPTSVDLPSGGAVVGGNVDFGSGKDGDDLQAFIDGEKDDGSNKTVDLLGSGSLTIKRYTTLTLRNLNITNTGSGYIYVEGTLIIDVNINISRIYRLIRVLPGGRVIWKGGSGTGTDITKEFIYVEKGGNLEYYGGTISGGEFGFHGYGTTYIYGGTIGGTKFGGYTYPSGTTTISGGTVAGGYYNGGITYVTGGTFLGGGTGTGSHVYHNGKGGTTTITGGTFGNNGSGTIYNEGNLNFGGDGYTYNVIYNGSSGRIYILGKLNIILRIHISITDIVLDTPIILGGDGYVLTEDDIKKIQIVLPNGYSWKYDSDLGGIIIISTTGINSVTSDNSTSSHYYDISGRKLDKMQKGINIVKSSNGKTRKVVIK